MRILALIPTLAFAAAAGAATLADVNVPDTATVAGQKLVLNGAGMRKKGGFIKVYVGALYLPSKTSTADAALAAGTAKVTMRFMRDVDAEKLRGAW